MGDLGGDVLGPRAVILSIIIVVYSSDQAKD
jgi:hypothetical protein